MGTKFRVHVRTEERFERTAGVDESRLLESLCLVTPECDYGNPHSIDHQTQSSRVNLNTRNPL